MALNHQKIKNAACRVRDYKIADGDGLYILIRPGGSKLWRLKYRFEGKEKVLSFGQYPDISPALARQMRTEAKLLLLEGIDPQRHVKPKPRPTRTGRSFEEIARVWHSNRASELDPAHAARVISRLERDVFPALGSRDISSISAPDVLAVIRTIEARGALDISRRAKQSIGQVYRFAIACGWADADPTISLSDALKAKPRVKHMARLPLKELGSLLLSIRDYDGDDSSRRRDITRDALRFTLLTWGRTSEIRFARWEEFEDLESDSPIWRVPQERMKMGREHLVPLSRQAVELLARRRQLSGEPVVFPGVKSGQPISANTMIYACYRMGYRGRQTVHGFRGLASTWANESERYRSDWVEAALAHADEDEVRSAYNGALYMSARKRMLQDWADELDRKLQEQVAVRPVGQSESSAVSELALAYVGLCG